MILNQIETVTVLTTGYAVTFSLPFSQGRVDALDRIKGLYYKERVRAGTPPAIRFTMKMEDDTFTLQITSSGCTDHKLMQSELLLLLKGINLMEESINRLPGLVETSSVSRRDTRGRFLPAHSTAA